MANVYNIHHDMSVFTVHPLTSACHSIIAHHRACVSKGQACCLQRAICSAEEVKINQGYLDKSISYRTDAEQYL